MVYTSMVQHETSIGLTFPVYLDVYDLNCIHDIILGWIPIGSSKSLLTFVAVMGVMVERGVFLPAISLSSRHTCMCQWWAPGQGGY